MGHEEITPELHRSLDQLAGQLVWKIGRDEETDEMIVRVGFASSAPRFARKSKLRAATDADVAEALKTGEYRVEWIE
ncbi:DUF3248 domain-containing protein [Deinococcus cellulosilyticus]|uniref:DUF3248 domain-containing protein n=1 Tax=Deinococcus cellulosilyticus (strain DSM 18568 / NBRC 106333 / KACC 11606 / 5516J-15) TaxID=1223518 RepID=A0A511NA36_DEIC1|nr:DUF3248 domain-containing protein [Deinococcus cellulosilyticus]GEM49386.1 hypothetical protein DC3_50210 [Deinococcus cellulosilyticus NBRC 106333 = KACC 11606]